MNVRKGSKPTVAARLRHVCSTSISRSRSRRLAGPFSADIVAKRFCASEGAILIQDPARIRNVDSKIHSSRFDCCAFLFYSVPAVTFATISANSRLMQCSKDAHGLQRSFDHLVGALLEM
jgi:hypothetical protein